MRLGKRERAKLRRKQAIANAALQRFERDCIKPWGDGPLSCQRLLPIPPRMRVTIRKGNRDWLMDQRPRGGHW